PDPHDAGVPVNTTPVQGVGGAFPASVCAQGEPNPPVCCPVAVQVRPVEEGTVAEDFFTHGEGFLGGSGERVFAGMVSFPGLPSWERLCPVCVRVGPSLQKRRPL